MGEMIGKLFRMQSNLFSARFPTRGKCCGWEAVFMMSFFAPRRVNYSLLYQKLIEM